MIPRTGQPPEKDRHYRLRPGAYAILPRAGQVLLTLQTDDPEDVQLPGGGIDPGESVLAALHREVLEETGWVIAAPRRIGAFRHFTFMPEYDLWAEKLCHIYVARPCLAKSAPIEEDHLSFWADCHAAADILGSAGNRRMYRRWLGQRGP